MNNYINFANKYTPINLESLEGYSGLILSSGQTETIICTSHIGDVELTNNWYRLYFDLLEARTRSGGSLDVCLSDDLKDLEEPMNVFTLFDVELRQLITHYSNLIEVDQS